MSAELQHGWYIGNIFISILYGIELVIYGVSIRVLLRKKPRDRTKSDVLYLFFSTLLLVLCTINVAANCVFGELWWISNQNYPGGSEQWFADNAAVWYQTMASAANVLVQLLADGLLIYRCFMLWNSFLVIGLPCLLWVASLGIGIATLYYSGSPGGDNFAGLAQTTSTAYLSCTMAINILSTTLICGRILYHARTTERALKHNGANQYYSVVTMIVESAALYTIFGLMYLISFAIGSELSALFMSLYAVFTVISPQLIIMRVVIGSAWNRTTQQNLTSMSFAQFTSVTGASQTLNNSGHISLSQTSLRDGKSEIQSNCDV